MRESRRSYRVVEALCAKNGHGARVGRGHRDDFESVFIVFHYNINRRCQRYQRYSQVSYQGFQVCVVIGYSRVWINRVRLPILLVFSWTGKMNIPPVSVHV